MKAAVLHGPGDIRVDGVPEPTVLTPTDALVRITASCICGSDLWHYRGFTRKRGRIGHEFLGVVEEVGAEVGSIKSGDLVIAPFVISCGVCAPCRSGWPTSCVRGTNWGGPDADGNPVDGGQGQYARVPLADGTLVAAPVEADDPRIPALLSLSDVMGTGHHAARSAGAGPGATVAVIGDGAVGLCAVLAAARLGADRVILLSTHADRADLGVKFGATDVVAARGDQAVDAVRDLTGGLGVNGACECVGTAAAWDSALSLVRPGGTVGWVGVPHDVKEGLPIWKMFNRNVTVRGGVAPARAYLPDLLPEVLAGTLDPGPVFTETVGLDDIAAGYRAMDERRAIKVLVRP
ncbi:MAG TPA: alcohol dehydrogenase catalytic domain-containing protein [Nakamurella sp.]